MTRKILRGKVSGYGGGGKPLVTHGRTTPILGHGRSPDGGFVIFQVGTAQSVFQTVPGNPGQGRKAKAKTHIIKK